MWNSRKYAAMAILGAGLAVAVATPSSAQSWGRGCGVSGSAPAGYAGVYTYGWPYGVVGDVGCPAYGYAGGGAYGYAGGGSPAIGYAAYGYAGGYGPFGYALNTDAGGCGGYGAYGSTAPYGFAGACRARRKHGYGGYVEARGVAPNGSMGRHVVSAKQAAYLDR